MACPKKHPVFANGKDLFVPGLEVVGGYADVMWLRCSACGRWFWAIDDQSKFQYQNSWELEPDLARRALVDRDPKELARLFVSMDLPLGPVWELTEALVEIFRKLTPKVSDADRAAAIEAAGPHARWSEAARVLRREAERLPRARTIQLPIDVRVPGASFREHYEVGDALVLLGAGPEMFRLEPRFLVRVPLAAPPRYFGSGNDRLIVRVGDAILVLDADGNATSWPISGDYNVLALDDAWWLFVPNTGAEERFVEMRLPDGQPRAKFRRRFARTEGWMAPPRRFAEGWLLSNLTDDDGKTQSLTLLDAELATAAYGDGETPDDRLVTPIDDASFWASAGGSLERWERRGRALVCTERFPSRGSLWRSGTLVSVETWGLVTARDAAGAVRWTYDAKTSGASYLTETPGGVLLYDDVRATVLDVGDGSVRTSFSIESASVFVGQRGTVYLLSLGELWTLREEARSTRVGLGAVLETTCGDDALLRRKDGTCVLVGPRGVRGKFSAKSASFSVIGTRGGPWVVEGDRIRGAFAKNAHVLAEGIAVGLGEGGGEGGVAGAVARRMPSSDAGSTYAIVLADGRVPLVVREYATGVIRVLRFPGASWQPEPDELALVATEAVAHVKAWLGTAAAERPTLAEIALSVATTLGEAFGERWIVSIPGTPEPSEMSLDPEPRGSAHVGVFDGKVVAWPASVAFESRAELAAKRDEIVAAVRGQKAQYERNVEASARVRALAEALVRRLSLRLGRRCKTWPLAAATHGGAVSATLVYETEPLRKIAEIVADGGAIRVHAGVAGERGYDATGEDADAMVEPIAEALERARTTLTLDKLVRGRRYRVLETLQALRAGDVVRFERFDDVDNHYGRYVFSDDGGRELEVTGDFSTPERSPLGATYRFLEEA